jgi:hypothetical protein
MWSCVNNGSSKGFLGFQRDTSDMRGSIESEKKGLDKSNHI